MPFDAMKGLQEALRSREERHSRVERTEISEEQQERNSRILLKLKKGWTVELNCHRAFHNTRLSGRVDEIDMVMKYLKIDGKTIWFDDIYAIRITDMR